MMLQKVAVHLLAAAVAAAANTEIEHKRPGPIEKDPAPVGRLLENEDGDGFPGEELMSMTAATMQGYGWWGGAPSASGKMCPATHTSGWSRRLKDKSSKTSKERGTTWSPGASEPETCGPIGQVCRGAGYYKLGLVLGGGSSQVTCDDFSTANLGTTCDDGDGDVENLGELSASDCADQCAARGAAGCCVFIVLGELCQWLPGGSVISVPGVPFKAVECTATPTPSPIPGSWTDFAMQAGRADAESFPAGGLEGCTLAPIPSLEDFQDMALEFERLLHLYEAQAGDAVNPAAWIGVVKKATDVLSNNKGDGSRANWSNLDGTKAAVCDAQWVAGEPDNGAAPDNLETRLLLTADGLADAADSADGVLLGLYKCCLETIVFSPCGAMA